MLSPVFVKGSLRFELEHRRLEFSHQNISPFGVTGLPWGELSATEHFGAKIEVEVDIQYDERCHFKAPAHLIREYTATSEAMGIKFELGPEQQLLLNDYVRKNGYCPSEFLRKYPRIPSNSMIQTYPTCALVSLAQGNTLALSSDHTLVFDVVNLSPNGALLSTENQMALMIQPGERIIVTLQPRGWFPTQIRIQAMICRVIDDITPPSGNLIRFMGVKFLKVDELNKTAFLDLLKDILEQLKQAAP